MTWHLSWWLKRNYSFLLRGNTQQSVIYSCLVPLVNDISRGLVCVCWWMFSSSILLVLHTENQCIVLCIPERSAMENSRLGARMRPCDRYLERNINAAPTRRVSVNASPIVTRPNGDSGNWIGAVLGGVGIIQKNRFDVEVIYKYFRNNFSWSLEK